MSFFYNFITFIGHDIIAFPAFILSPLFYDCFFPLILLSFLYQHNLESDL